MKLKTYRYGQDKGFNASLDAELDSPSTLVLVFGSPQFRDHQAPFQELRRAFPNSIFMGCSSSGEIFSDHVYDQSLSIAVLRFSKSLVRSACFPVNEMTESFEIGKKLALSLKNPDLTGLFVLSDGLKVNGSDLVRGISQEISPKVVVTGGLAGDGSDFKETWTLKNGAPSSGHVSAIGFYGKHVQINHSSQGGWDIFGPERHVTKSQGNILYELDGRPALALYKEYLGEKASGLPATGLLFPLQIRSDVKNEKRIVRTILGVDEKSQSLIFAGDIPQGSLAQLMRANFDRLIEGASSAAGQLKSSTAHKDQLAIAISCVGRRLVLGERTDEEVEATLEKLPNGTQQIGFYSYGEISPFVKGQSCELHNQTMTLTTIAEDEAA